MLDTSNKHFVFRWSDKIEQTFMHFSIGSLLGKSLEMERGVLHKVGLL